jgi:transcriptional regulator with XRE-family HTH domain
MSTVVERLNRIRLLHDLTYADLAEQIGIDASAVHRLLQRADRKPLDRTLYKVEQFVDRFERAHPPAVTRRRRVSA